MHTLETSTQQPTKSGVKMATTSYRGSAGFRHKAVARLETGDGQDRLSEVHIRVESDPVVMMRFSEADARIQWNAGNGQQAEHPAGGPTGSSAGVVRHVPRHQTLAEPYPARSPIPPAANAEAQARERRAKDVARWKASHGIPDRLIDDKTNEDLMNDEWRIRSNAEAKVLRRNVRDKDPEYLKNIASQSAQKRAEEIFGPGADKLMYRRLLSEAEKEGLTLKEAALRDDIKDRVRMQGNAGNGQQAANPASAFPLRAGPQPVATPAGGSAGSSAGVVHNAPPHHARAEFYPARSPASPDAEAQARERRAKDVAEWKEKNGIPDDMTSEQTDDDLIEGNRPERANARKRVLYRAKQAAKSSA